MNEFVLCDGPALHGLRTVVIENSLLRIVVLPEARAASTKSRCLACVVTVSETRTMGGMNTTASAMMELDRPLPISPQMAIANRMEGNA